MSEEVVELITEEMINEIGGTLPEDIVYLSDHVAPKELIPLNPVVAEYMKILEKSSIVYDPDNEKESIQEFKDAKGQIRSFRAEVKRTKSKMKKQILESGRAMDRIEKIFVEGATEVEDKLLVNFKVYLDEEARKKEEKEKAKNKAVQDEIDRLASERNEAVEKMAVQNAFNNIYYETLMNYQNDVNALIKNGSEDALESFWNNLKAKKAFTIVKEKDKVEDWNRLDADQVIRCNAEFEKIKENIGVNITSQITILRNKKTREVETKIEEVKKEEKAIDFSSFDTACITISNQLVTMRSSVDFIIKEVPKPDEAINHLMNIKNHLQMAQNLIDKL